MYFSTWKGIPEWWMTKTVNYLPINSCPIYNIYNAYRCVCPLTWQWTYLHVTVRESFVAYYMINFSDCSMKSQAPISHLLCVMWDKILFGGTGMVNAHTTVRFVLKAGRGSLPLVSPVGWKEGEAADSASNQETEE